DAVPHVPAVTIEKLLGRHDILRQPFGPFGRERGIDLRGDVVFRAGSPEAAGGLDLVLAGLGRADLYGLLVHDGIELLAHLAGLGLALDLVPIDHAAAVGKRAQSVARFHRAGALVLGLGYDLERAMPVHRVLRVRDEPHTRPLAVEPPVRRQRHQTSAVGAADRAGPEVTVGDTIWLRLGRVEGRETLHGSAPKLGTKLLVPG